MIDRRTLTQNVHAWLPENPLQSGELPSGDEGISNAPRFALIRLFWSVARLHNARRLPVDGSPPPPRRQYARGQPRPGRRVRAGRYLRPGKMEDQHRRGPLPSDSRRTTPGIPLHRMRMERVIEDLDKRGMMLRGSRRKSKIERIHLYTEFPQKPSGRMAARLIRLRRSPSGALR